MSNWARKNMLMFYSFTSSVQCFHHYTYNLKLNNNGKAKVGLIPACAVHQYNSGFLKPELYKVSFAFSIFFVPVCGHFTKSLSNNFEWYEIQKKKEKLSEAQTCRDLWCFLVDAGLPHFIRRSSLLDLAHFHRIFCSSEVCWLLCHQEPYMVLSVFCIIFLPLYSCPQRHVSFPLARASAECWGIHCVV